MPPKTSSPIPVHIPTAFKVGDRVRIVRRIDNANSWSEGWVIGMDAYIGQEGKVIDAGPTIGFQVETSDGESFYYPSCALEKVGKLTKLENIQGMFNVGDMVRITRKVQQKDVKNWSTVWVDRMDEAVGRTGTVIKESKLGDGYQVRFDGIGPEDFFFPSCILQRVGDEAPLVHNDNLFKVGDRVEIYRRTPKATAWVASWVSQMNGLVGRVGTISKNAGAGGYSVKLDGGGKTYSYPSCALRLEGGNNVNNQKPAAGQELKTRRVRVGKGPWDSAPCTHLRWQLMGFFREKLALVKTKVVVKDSSGKDIEVEFSQIEVACTKCNTKVTLKAK